jgi:hypothetical protein
VTSVIPITRTARVELVWASSNTVDLMSFHTGYERNFQATAGRDDRGLSKCFRTDPAVSPVTVPLKRDHDATLARSEFQRLECMSWTDVVDTCRNAYRAYLRLHATGQQRGSRRVYEPKVAP